MRLSKTDGYALLCEGAINDLVRHVQDKRKRLRMDQEGYINLAVVHEGRCKLQGNAKESLCPLLSGLYLHINDLKIKLRTKLFTPNPLEGVEGESFVFQVSPGLNFSPCESWPEWAAFADSEHFATIYVQEF